MSLLCRAALLSLILVPLAQAQQIPTPAAAAWWNETTALANDAMEGRDTGTEAYERAAKYVATKFAAAGLKPAGDNGTFFQRVPMHQVDLDTEHSAVEIVHNPAPAGAAGSVPLQLLQEVTLTPREDLPPLTEAPMVFLGYGLPTPAPDLQGKIAVFFNNTPAGLSAADRDSFALRRTRALSLSGAIALVLIDNPNAIEPFHWPTAYARSVTLANPDTPAPLPARSPSASARKPRLNSSSPPVTTSEISTATVHRAPRSRASP